PAGPAGPPRLRRRRGAARGRRSRGHDPAPRPRAQPPRSTSRGDLGVALVATGATWDHARVGPSRRKEEPRSPCAAAALALDAESAAPERPATALERAPVENEKGLERARRLLGDVEACRERLGARLQAFARALD